MKQGPRATIASGHIRLAENVAVLTRAESVRSNNEARFLMCPPHHFGVEYVINPWMQGQINAADQELASRQWMQLHAIMSSYADVALMPAVSGLPDLVFTANAALVYSQTAVLSSFRCMERQPEARYYAEWLSADGFEVKTLPSGTLFEGAGGASVHATATSDSENSSVRTADADKDRRSRDIRRLCHATRVQRRETRAFAPNEDANDVSAGQ